MTQRPRTIGDAVDECIKLTTEEWFRQHGGMRSREEAFAEDVKVITSSIERHPGGRLMVQVGVVARRRSQELINWYSFERRGSRGYVQVVRTKASA